MEVVETGEKYLSEKVRHMWVGGEGEERGGGGSTHLGLQVLVLTDEGGERAGLVETGAQQTRDHLDDRVGRQECSVLLGCTISTPRVRTELTTPGLMWTLSVSPSSTVTVVLRPALRHKSSHVQCHHTSWQAATTLKIVYPPVPASD